MLLDEYDSYYTPDTVADQLVGFVDGSEATRCFDSNCGDGGLLRAAARQFSRIRCIGLDKDKRAIATLRRNEPRWSLWLGDNLRAETWSRAAFAQAVRDVDVALMNPPFSMRAQKGVEGPVDDVRRCSVAMAHVLTTLQRVSPSQCAAIVPESLYYSELDSSGRAWIARDYRMVVHTELENTTFRGTRANALLISFKRRDGALRARSQEFAGSNRVTRGGLPLHESTRDKHGIELVHSTAIGPLARGEHPKLPRVRSIARGVVSGHVILVPRVGNLVRESVEPVFLRDLSQLSDCVLAIRFRSKAEASKAARYIQRNWAPFSGLWRGTGARYVTVARFMDWVANHLG